MAATLVDISIADGATGIELVDRLTGTLVPADVGVPIVSITATVDGVGRSVTVTTVAGGTKNFTVAWLFRHRKVHEVEITVTTSDADVDVISTSFRVRPADSGYERVEVYLPAHAYSSERVDVFPELRGVTASERVHLTVLQGGAVTPEAVTLSATPGLPRSFHTPERVELLASILEVVAVAYSESMDVGDLDGSRMSISEEIQGTERSEYTLSEQVTGIERGPAYALTLNNGKIETSPVPLAMDVGNPGNSALSLTVEGETALLAGVEVRVELRNEAMADVEDS